MIYCTITPIIILGEFEQLTKNETVSDLLPVSPAIRSPFQHSAYFYFSIFVNNTEVHGIHFWLFSL